MTKDNIIIIAISAVSGGGKTYITNKLKKELTNSKALYFDDYDFNGPESICKWVENGSDYNEWNLEALINDIQEVIKSSDIKYLILDYPFSYKHDLMKNYINHTIFIDTPLDIALARRIIRDNENINVKENVEDYLKDSRKAYLDMLNRIKPNSDFIIDGSLNENVISKRIIDYIKGEKHEN